MIKTQWTFLNTTEVWGIKMSELTDEGELFTCLILPALNWTFTDAFYMAC